MILKHSVFSNLLSKAGNLADCDPLSLQRFIKPQYLQLLHLPT